MRLLRGIRADGALTLHEHVAAHGPLPALGARSSDALLDLIERSGLRGHGGAHAPAGMKLRAVAGRKRPIVVANGAESEPASGKDAVLLSHTPHLVIDGAVVAAAAAGAREAILYVKPGQAYDDAEAALAEREGRDHVALSLVEAPRSYVAGQETAAIEHLNGRPALPKTVPPRPFERGVDRRPTVVFNVETLAHMALIARHGVDWFRSAGSHLQPGTALVTVSGAVERPGVYEIAFGTALGEVVAGAGAGGSEAPRAVLLGGYGGAWAGAGKLDARLQDGELDLGAGVVGVLGRGSCGVLETSRILDYLAAETAGQCGPCVHGLHAIAGTFAALADGTADHAAAARLHRWAAQVTGRGACRHPDGAARLVNSALRVFAKEIRQHEHGRCTGDGAPVLPVPVVAGGVR